MSIDKRTTGLFHKFNVQRTDGTDAPGRKHDGCDYFVLDLTHDEFALDALKAYARKYRKQFPVLAADLDVKIGQMKALRGRFFTRPSGHGR